MKAKRKKEKKKFRPKLMSAKRNKKKGFWV